MEKLECYGKIWKSYGNFFWGSVGILVRASRMIGQPLFYIPLCRQPFEGLHPILILPILIYYLPISFFCLHHLCKSCWSCYVPIPSQFAFSHSGDIIFIRSNSMPDFFIRNMIPLGDTQKSLEASHFCILYLSLYLCYNGPYFAGVQEDWNDQGTHHSDFGAEGNVLVFPWSWVLTMHQLFGQSWTEFPVLILHPS